MEADRRVIGAVADDSDNLPEPARLAFPQKRFKEQATDALPRAVVPDVNGILDGMPVSGPGAERASVGVSDHLAIALRNEVGKSPVEQVSTPAGHLLNRRRIDLEGGKSVQNMVAINRLHGG